VSVVKPLSYWSKSAAPSSKPGNSQIVHRMTVTTGTAHKRTRQLAHPSNLASRSDRLSLRRLTNHSRRLKHLRLRQKHRPERTALPSSNPLSLAVPKNAPKSHAALPAEHALSLRRRLKLQLKPRRKQLTPKRQRMHL